MNGTTKLWAAALLLGVLVAGGVAGAAADRMVVRDDACPARDRDDDDRRDRESYLDRLSSELDLTAAQRSELSTVIDRHRERFSSFWAEVGPELDEMRQEFRSDVRSVLTPEQERRYEQLLEKRDRHRGSSDKDRKDRDRG